jgi:hypothetical protein
MFKTLSGISVDGGLPGVAFGGGIYSISCDVGSVSDPTRITLNIVSENGAYATPQLNVTAGGGKTILIGTGSNIMSFYNMYVYKYNFNSASAAKTLSVSFVDHSVALDKVFLGLTGRHNTSEAIPVSATYPFTVNCTQCNSLWPRQVAITGNVTKTIWGTPAGGAISVSGPGGINGGYAILGMEQWTDGNCDIPKVEYNFNELLTVLGALGYDVSSLAAFNRSPFYQASYTGTAREVLNAWASDFSFSFALDPTVSMLRIVGTDLTVPLSLASIKSAIYGAGGAFSSGSGAGSLIRSHSESTTLENTFRQEPVVKNIKPAKSFSRKQVSYTPVAGKPVTIRDAIGNTGHLGRTDYEMQVSVALAKYKPEARNLWLSSRTAASGVAANSWPSLGFIPAPAAGAQQQYGITDDPNAQFSYKERIVRLFRSDSADDAFLHPIWSNPDNYYVYIGVWNEAYQGAMESYDAELAEFYNKYAYWYGNQWDSSLMSFTGSPGITNPPPSYRECPDVVGWGSVHKYYDYVANISTLPESKLYGKGAFPFQNILRANAGAFSATQGVADPDGTSIFSLDDNAWGTHQEHVDNLFANKWVLDTSQTNNWGNISPQSDIEHFLPIYARFDSDQVIMSELRSILPLFKQLFLNATKINEGYFPGVAIIPKLDKCILTDPTTNTSQKVLEVGGIIQQVNAVTYENTRRRRLEMVGDNVKDCTVYCEEDISSALCECPDIEDPLHKFASCPSCPNCYAADAFQVNHLGSSVMIIFPVGGGVAPGSGGCDYLGYWKSDVTFRGTYPKAIDIMGTPGVNIGNVMSTKVIDVDITQEMNPPEMGLAQQFIINGHPVPVTMSGYYSALSSMNQSAYLPGETINVKVDGIEFDALLPFLNPSSGMTNFNVVMDGEGLSTDLTFASRTPKMPKRDVFMQQVGPRATQGRAGFAPNAAGGGNPGSGVNMPILP